MGIARSREMGGHPETPRGRYRDREEMLEAVEHLRKEGISPVITKRVEGGGYLAHWRDAGHISR